MYLYLYVCTTYDVSGQMPADEFLQNQTALLVKHYVMF